jgi:hypothetical protein
MKIKLPNTAGDLSPPFVLYLYFLIINKTKIIMKKSILLILVTFLFFNKSNGQITRGNWMVGGNGSFVFSKASSGGSDSKTANLSLAPDIGYFFIDKFAGGVRLSFNRDHIKYGPSDNFSTFKNYSIGPFVRYYLLNVDRQDNILIEGSYQFGDDKVKTNNSTSNSSTNIISFPAGPVIYFNSSVGIEFLLNYSSTGTTGFKGRGDSFGVSIGLQIHLEKNKN